MDPEGIARARHALTDRLAAWGLTDSDGALLVFSELVTNAVVHAGGALRASVVPDGRRVRIDVTDAGAGVVAVRGAGSAPGGLGLRIVSRLSERWGSEPTPDGKVVWAVVPCGSDAGAAAAEREPHEETAEATVPHSPPAGGALPLDDVLQPLQRLVGTWSTAASHPATGALHVFGSVEISWLEGQRFLLHRARTDHPDFPDSLWVMGAMDHGRSDPTAASPAGHGGELSAHCFDSRGVFRVYAMAVDDGSWQLWRDEPGLSQRFTGSFRDRGDTIAGQWQLCHDGVNWDDDLQITYTRRA